MRRYVIAVLILFVCTCTQAQTGFDLRWSAADHQTGDQYTVYRRTVVDTAWSQFGTYDSIFALISATPFETQYYRVVHLRDTVQSLPSHIVSGIYLPWCSDTTASCYVDTMYVHNLITVGDTIKMALCAVWLSHPEAWDVQYTFTDSVFTHATARSVYDYNGDSVVNLRDLLYFIKEPYTTSDLVKLAAVFHKRAYYEWPESGTQRVAYLGDEQDVDISLIPADVLDALGVPHEGTNVPITRLGASYPNPFTDRTTISYDLGKRSRVELCIYDISGKRVKVLMRGELGIGSYVATWDGLDSHGDQVAGGVYFYRLKAGKFEATGKTVLVR